MKHKQNLYVNAQKSTAMIHAVEFARAGDENLTFYKISSLSSAEEAKKWLKDKGLAEEFLGQTELNNDTTLVVRTPLNSQAQLAALKSEGVNLHHPTPEEKRVSLWGLRGGLSMVGQTLQLTSSYLKPDGIDGATATFAVSNILANISNMIFGSQKSADPHRLHFLKSTINQNLTEDYGVGDLPAPEEKRSQQRPQPPKSLFDTLRGYSVTIGEVGLRMFGAFAMAFPVKNWKPAFQELKQGNFGKTLSTAFNSKDSATGKVGLAYLTGKTIALFSKTPDPYNPEKATTLNRIRENVLFKLSSIIELGAAGYLSYDRFKNKKVNLKKIGGKDIEIPDYFGGIGGTIFTGAFGIRYFAPFGEREVDMGELKAHVSDAIAQVPQEKRSEAMVKIVGDLVDHFGEKKVSFGQLYADIAADLQKQHNITLPGLPEAQNKPAPAIAKAEEKAAAPVVAKEDKGFANDTLRKSADRPAPAASYRDRATTEPVNTVLGVA